MAEFLIYSKPHWMDALTQTEIDDNIKKYPNFQAKYDRRYQVGDVFRVYPDGKMWDKEKGDWKEVCASKHLSMVRVEGLSYEDAKIYMETDTGPIERRRRYKLKIDELKTNEITDLTAKSQTIVTKVDFENKIEDKV